MLWREKNMIRILKQDDVPLLKQMLGRIPNFSEVEVEIAMELINIAGTNLNQTDYNIFVYDADGTILGYHCTGKRPLTEGTYDLYWIVADPLSAIKGIGKALLEHAENFVFKNNGRLILRNFF